MKQSSYAYSFSKTITRKSEKTTNLTTPGPGQYSATNLFKPAAPQWKLGTSKRKGWDLVDNPGPGKYEPVKVTLTKQSNAPNYTFRLKNQNVVDPGKMTCSPGPGNYEPKWQGTKSSFAAYTIRKRPKTGQPGNFVPGVGHYQLRKPTNDFDVPSYKFGKEKQIVDLLSKSCVGFPGPGRYEHKEFFGKIGPKISVGKEVRGQDKRPKTPGPGHYEYSTITLPKAPKYSISAVKTKTNIADAKTPGPGTYTSGFGHRPSTPAYL